MSLSKTITTKKNELVELEDTLSAQTKQLEEDSTNVEVIDAMADTMDKIDVVAKQLNTLNRTEEGSKEKAMVTTTKKVKAELVDNKVDNFDFIVKSALVTLESKATNVSIDDAIAKRYGMDEMFKNVAPLMTKAATPQNPAMTTVPEWAGALVRDSFGAFLDFLSVTSIIGSLPLARYSFNGANSLKIPKRLKRYPDDKNLAAAFTAEGAPIRVGSSQIGTVTLTPKKAGIIGTFTAEIFEQSTPNIESLIRAFMLEDTSIMLDTVFLGAGAGTTTTPAGIANGVTAITSGGVTPDKIAADLSKAVSQMITAGVGQNMVWVMNPVSFSNIAYMQNAVGTPSFPETSNNVLRNIRVITSLNVDPTKIYLIDAASIGIAGGTPQFLASNQATLHEEYSAADVKPIVDGAGASAQPVRSLYQTDSFALRMITPIDWSVLRDGSVQLIDTITWA